MQIVGQSARFALGTVKGVGTMHYAALVIVPEGVDDVVGAVETILAPYDENACEYDEDGFIGGEPFWDWYAIGGSFTGLLDGYNPKDDPRNYDENGKRHWSSAPHPGDIAPASAGAEARCYRVVSPEGTMEREMRNPEWQEGDSWDTYFVDNPEFHKFRAEQLIKHRNGTVVVVDYHS